MTSDARGTGFFDASMRDILYAFRTFRRAPLAAVTIVTTVALGLGLVAAVFTFFNAFFFHVDAVRNPGELYGVERSRDPAFGDRVAITRADYDALRRETGVFTDAIAQRRGVGARVDGRAIRGTLVTGNFFHMLGVTPALGRVLTPADEGRVAGRSVIVLSHRGWSRVFGKDRHVVGRVVRLNGFPYEIVGVTPDGFRGLTIGPPDFWAPLSLAGQFRRNDAGKEDAIEVDIIGRLKPDVSPEKGAAGLTVWASGLGDPDPARAGAANIRLRPRQGTVANDLLEVLAVFVPLLIVFGLILVTACANVANLLLARGVSRQREIGIRLSLGASRRRIVRQLLTESLLLALASAAGALVISRLVLAGVLYAAVATLPAEMLDSLTISVPAADWRVVMFLLAGAIGSTAFFGLAPALQATRLELVRSMRGEVTRDARPSRARNALIATQVGVSALLLICAAVFLRSAFAGSSADVGVRIADTISVEIANEPLRPAVVAAVSGHAGVAAVVASRPGPLAAPLAAAAGTASRRLPVGYRFVSPDYFKVLDIPVWRGRGFTDAERSADAGVAVVSETAARQLWPDGDALGQVLQLEIDPPRSVLVAGVVRDVPGFRSAEWPLAAVYLPTTSDSADTTLTLRVLGDPEQVRAALFARLTTVDPAIDQIRTLTAIAGIDAFILRFAFWVTVALAGLALALTVSGLFSVLSYIVEQRTKEIGVRMALGATTRSVTRLVLSQALRPVGVGLVAGGSLAAAVAIVLVSIASEIRQTIQVLDPVAYAVSILCIVTACMVAAWLPAQRAAKIDPIAMLRQE